MDPWLFDYYLPLIGESLLPEMTTEITDEFQRLSDALILPEGVLSLFIEGMKTLWTEFDAWLVSGDEAVLPAMNLSILELFQSLYEQIVGNDDSWIKKFVEETKTQIANLRKVVDDMIRRLRTLIGLQNKTGLGGNDGGDGTPPASRAPSYGGGGGGGAGSAGVDATNTKAGNGGNGSSVTDIFGAAPKPFYAPTNGLYSGGGGGGYYTGCGSGSPTQGIGGPGGGGPGGAGVNSPGTAGTTNTGGGGGGATDTGPYDQSGGNGGSGVVLIRYRYQ